MTERANRIVKEAVARGGGDFVEEVAAELPLQAIADLSAYRRRTASKLFDWSNPMLASEDPDFAGDPTGGGDRAPRLRDGHGRRTRKANPQDDIITKLINADKDGRGSTTTSSATS